MARVIRPGYKRSFIALLLFGASFGYVEAAAVSYLRSVFQPVHQRYYPARSEDDLLPMLSVDQVASAGHEYARLVAIEHVREAATLAMLAAVAIAVGRSSGQSFANFLIAFGVWDLSFYAFLKLLTHWPKSLLTWDVLFLVPVPWVAPVLAPVLASLSMIGAGLLYLIRDYRGRAMRWSLLNRLGMLAGVMIVILTFTLEFRNASAGGMPHRFNWSLFLFGEMIGLLSFLIAPSNIDSRR